MHYILDEAVFILKICEMQNHYMNLEKWLSWKIGNSRECKPVCESW